MVDAVQHEVAIAQHLVVEKVLLGVEQEAVQQILNEREGEHTQQEHRKRGHQTHIVVVERRSETGVDHQMENQHVVPEVVAEHLEEVRLEHSRRGTEQPVRRIHHLQILLVIQLPDLRHKRQLRSNEPSQVALERADHHGVGHLISELIVQAERLAHVLVLVVEQQPFAP